MSWTGSEQQRREQGICMPPAHPPNKTPKFSIPKGTKVFVCRVDDLHQQWQEHRTREDLGFGGCERYQHWQYIFRHIGWFIRVPKAWVDHRKA